MTRWLALTLLLAAPSALAQAGRPEDIVALRQLLEAHEFQRLDSAFAQRRLDADRTPANEARYSYAYDAFSAADSSLGPHLDAWVARRAQSPYARLARSDYLRAMAVEARGSAWAAETKPQQFEQMHVWLKLSLADASRAIELDSTDVEPYAAIIATARLVGADDVARQAVDRAVAVSPTTLLRRLDYLAMLRPRWGGEEGAMDRFAQTAQQYADRNPRLRLLLGYSAFDRAEGLVEDGQYQAAIAAYTTALSYGEHWRYRFGRGKTYSRMEEPEKALVDLNRVIAERPGHAEALAWRATSYAELADVAEPEMREAYRRRARQDVRFALLLDPGDDHLAWLRENYPKLFVAPSEPTAKDQ